MKRLVAALIVGVGVTAFAQNPDPSLQPPDEASTFPYTAPARSNLTPNSVTGEAAPTAPAADFVKPVGPKAGGVLVVPHPNAPKGLIRINKDNTYQYKTQKVTKSQSV